MKPPPPESPIEQVQPFVPAASMLRIDCPHCGLRDEPEFRWGGEVPLTRPGPPSSVSDTAWAEYLFFRNNPKGITRERWLHWAGCRQWLVLTRDTTTHAIVSTTSLAAARQELGA